MGYKVLGLGASVSSEDIAIEDMRDDLEFYDHALTCIMSNNVGNLSGAEICERVESIVYNRRKFIKKRLL
jgi:hypothetical protein